MEEKKKMLEDFKESLTGKSLDELKAIEQEIIAEADKTDVEVKESKFKLPKKNYDAVAGIVREFLNKQTITWQYTVAYVALYEFWDPEKFAKEISYPVLDATLQMLGQLQFTGYDEWKKVITLVDYFKPLDENYAEMTEKIYIVANKHNSVIEAIQLNTPIESKKD